MRSTDFVAYFNLIKPSFEELTASSGSPDIASEISEDFNLIITSNNVYENDIIDVAYNTNIADLYFSSIRLFRKNSIDPTSQIGNIVEKGDLIFDSYSKQIIFKEMYDDGYNSPNYTIDQSEFLKFFIKYLELDFNRIFRAGAQSRITSDISLDITEVKSFPVLEELLSEIGCSVNDL